MAEAYPKSRFFGFDYHGASIDTAKQRAAEAGVGERTQFVKAIAANYRERDFDLVCFFDCLHDMGDPTGAARHAYESLRPDGTVLLVEPFANDTLEANMNPLGRMFYAVSTFVCTPNSLSQEVGLGLGAQAGEARLSDVLHQAGFTKVRRAAETPFNLILEARK
jgi:SAM-dependent methyltransferase